MHPRANKYLSNIYLLVFDTKNNFQRAMVLFDTGENTNSVKL